MPGAEEPLIPSVSVPGEAAPLARILQIGALDGFGWALEGDWLVLHSTDAATLPALLSHGCSFERDAGGRWRPADPLTQRLLGGGLETRSQPRSVHADSPEQAFALKHELRLSRELIAPLVRRLWERWPRFLVLAWTTGCEEVFTSELDTRRAEGVHTAYATAGFGLVRTWRLDDPEKNARLVSETRRAAPLAAVPRPRAAAAAPLAIAV
jgi:hypothetical protein